MDFLTSLFFESPVKLGIFSFVLFAVVLLARTRMRSEAWRSRSLPITLLVIVLLFTLQMAIETRRERVLARLDAFVQAIETPNPTAMKNLIASTYDSEGFDKAAFLEALDRWLEQIDVFDARYRRRDVEVHGDTADMTLGATATVVRNGGTGESHWGRWKIKWVEELGEWRIQSIRVEMIDAIPIEQMRPHLP